MTQLRALAPGKVNLCLFLGPLRPDGYHELVSLIDSVDLCDELTLDVLPEAGGDEVVCAGVEGENLAARALALYREHSGWDGPPVRVTIDKRVPVAAGMGGGSADAAATLRLVAQAASRPGDPLLAELAPLIGADVPSQLRPGLTLASGFGEQVRSLDLALERAYVVLPAAFGLSTPAVFARADELGLPRDAPGLAEQRASVEEAVAAGELPADVLVNDLEAAAVALRPEVGVALESVRFGDAHLLAGSGPTVFAAFFGAGAGERAERAAAALPGSVACAPVCAGVGVAA